MNWGGLLAIGIGIVAALITVVGIAVTSRPGVRESWRGSGSMAGGVLGVADEIFAPGAADARRALQEESQLIVQAPTPDGDLGISEGRIRIRVEEQDA